MSKKLEERMTALEKRIDDFNTRNDKYYAELKQFLIQVENDIKNLQNIAHKHFWMGD